MQKIPTLLVRDPDDRADCLLKVTPGCEWVLNGEAIATRKYDDTCVYLDADGEWWARREVKPGRRPPINYRPLTFDEVTGKTIGWEPIAQSAFFKWHDQALTVAQDEGSTLGSGTYELCGPKINNNPEGYPEHRLIRHADALEISEASHPRTPMDLVETLQRIGRHGWEGIVWADLYSDRRAKLKAKDVDHIDVTYVSPDWVNGAAS